jgi:hypothetical protein
MISARTIHAAPARCDSEIDMKRHAVKCLNEISEYCPVCGKRVLPKAPSNGCLIELATHVGDETRFLVRAHIDIGPPIVLHPFAISEVGSVGRRIGYRWRTGMGACTLFAPAPLKNFDEAEAYLKSWAEKFIAWRVAPSPVG